MNEQIFSGISKNGNFQEALADAIQNAKMSIPSDFVTWRVYEISGEDGGFVTVEVLRVLILAKAYQNIGSEKMV